MSTNKFLTLVSGIQTLVTAIASSAGVGDANKVIATGSDGKIDLTFMPSGIGPSTKTVVASENLAAGDFLNIYNNGGTLNCRKADASNGRPAHGFTLSSVSSAANATVYLQGENTGLSTLTPGTRYYLSAGTAGGVTATAPSTTGQIVQYLGTSLGTTSIQFEDNGYIAL